MKNQFTLFLLLVSLFPTVLFGSATGDTSKFQFIVNFEAFTSEDTILAYLEEINAEEIWEIDDLDMALWEVNSFPVVLASGEEVYDINTMIRAVRKKTRIKNAEFNFDTSLPDEEGSETPGGCFDPSQFQIPLGNEEVKISILDTGISDMTDNSTDEYNYNLINYTGYDYVNDDEIPDDENGHGTHVAGLIHSIAQYNPNTNITFDIRKTHDMHGKAMVSDIVLAMYEAIEDDADIINLSFGARSEFVPGTFYPLQVVIQEAMDEDVLVVAAAGNESSDNDNLENTALPASFPDFNILAVTATDCNGDLAPFANYGATTVDVSTYGINIPGPDLASGIKYLSGTSQSTAIVTAVAAMKATSEAYEEIEDLKCSITDGQTPIKKSNSSIEGCVVSRNIETNISKSADIKVYPTNISNSNLVVEAPQLDNITIYNGKGQRVFQQKYNNSQNVEISTSSWQNGVYFVRVNNENTKKIIVY